MVDFEEGCKMGDMGVMGDMGQTSPAASQHPPLT